MIKPGQLLNRAVSTPQKKRPLSRRRERSASRTKPAVCESKSFRLDTLPGDCAPAPLLLQNIQAGPALPSNDAAGQNLSILANRA